MIRLAILDQDGKQLKPQDVGSAKELLTLVEQAKSVIRDCERLAGQIGIKHGAAIAGKIPYSS
jgi:hypothetical protein